MFLKLQFYAYKAGLKKRQIYIQPDFMPVANAIITSINVKCIKKNLPPLNQYCGIPQTAATLAADRDRALLETGRPLSLWRLTFRKMHNVLTDVSRRLLMNKNTITHIFHG